MSADNVALPAFAAGSCAAAPLLLSAEQQSVDMSRQMLSSKPAAAAFRIMGQTDRRTSDRCIDPASMGVRT